MTSKRKISLTRPEREGPVTTYARPAEENIEPAGRRTPFIYPPLKGGIKGPPTTEGELDEARELVAKLSPALRKQLLTELALAQQTQEPASRDLTMWATAVQTALRDADGGADGGGVGLIPLRRILGARSCWAPVEAFMSSVGYAELSVVLRNAAYALLAELLVEHARSIARHADIPLTGKLVGNCTGNIAPVFDQAFPGYAAAGLAHIVLPQTEKRT